MLLSGSSNQGGEYRIATALMCLPRSASTTGTVPFTTPAAMSQKRPRLSTIECGLRQSSASVYTALVAGRRSSSNDGGERRWRHRRWRIGYPHWDNRNGRVAVNNNAQLEVHRTTHNTSRLSHKHTTYGTEGNTTSQLMQPGRSGWHSAHRMWAAREAKATTLPHSVRIQQPAWGRT